MGRTVSLQRTLTEAEWERLVVDLRETFDARGSLRSEGSFRQWTNGNLQALLEPTPTGHRLRLRTMKGDAYGMITGGFALLVLDVFLMVLRNMTGSKDGGALLLLGVWGAGMVAFGALRVTGWAKRRQQQMEEIVARLTESTP